MFIPFDRAWLSLEPVGDENLMLLIDVTRCQNIGTLECLVEVTENIVDDYDALFGISWASNISKRLVMS